MIPWAEYPRHPSTIPLISLLCMLTAQLTCTCKHCWLWRQRIHHQHLLLAHSAAATPVQSVCRCSHAGARVHSSGRAIRLAVVVLGADPDPGRLHGSCRKAEHVRRLRQNLLGGLTRSVTGTHLDARHLQPPSVKSESCARCNMKQVWCRRYKGLSVAHSIQHAAHVRRRR